MEYLIDTSAVEIDNTPAKGVELVEIHDLETKQRWFAQFLNGMRLDTEHDPEYYTSGWKFLEGSCDGQVVGFIRLREHSKEFAEEYGGEVWSLCDAYILPEYRHRGIFKNMIKLAVSEFDVKAILDDESGFKEHFVFYSSLGFNLSSMVPDDIEWSRCWSFHNSFRDVVTEIAGIPKHLRNGVIVDDDGNLLDDQEAAWKEARRESSANHQNLE